MQRIALGIEYDGAAYFGWQRQTHRPSIQAALEAAIAKVANHPVATYCAGRTDAGVHASGQVVHFDSPAKRQTFEWIRGINTYLPPDIRALWCQETMSDFDARKAALSRRYCYIIANRSVSPGIMQRALSWVLPALDEELLQQGATHLIGTHDFTSFRDSQCQAKTPQRTLTRFVVTRRGENIIFDVTANAFLHHMVRNMVGALLEVGQKKRPPQWIAEVLAAKDRRAAGVTASPNGLYLVQVRYPEQYQIPITPLPWFLPREEACRV